MINDPGVLAVCQGFNLARPPWSRRHPCRDWQPPFPPTLGLDRRSGHRSGDPHPSQSLIAVLTTRDEAQMTGRVTTGDIDIRYFDVQVLGFKTRVVVIISDSADHGKWSLQW